MENMPDAQHIEAINQIDWKNRRRYQEEVLEWHASELEADLERYHFDTDDERLAYMHDALRRINEANPYFGREGKVTGICGVPCDDREGFARVVEGYYDEKEVINLGLTVLMYAKTKDDTDPDQTGFYVGHWLEYVADNGDRRSIVAQIGDKNKVDVEYGKNAIDYEASLRSILPRDMMDMFERITATQSDDHLATVLQLLAHMEIDARHIPDQTMDELARYVNARLKIHRDLPYKLTRQEALMFDDEIEDQVVVETDAVLINGLAVVQPIDTRVATWHLQVQYLTSNNAYITGGQQTVALSSIEALHPLISDEGDDDE